MVATSTHDTKRSEDVRARLCVLSELPDAWRQRVNRWSRLHRRRRREVNGVLIPSRNAEYFLYQTLVGAWPLAATDGHVPEDFSARIEAYMVKAAREAKRHTSWLNPNPEYEAALTGFVRGVLHSRRFLADFLPFQKQIARYGLLNGLSQTLIRLTVPGVPDTYQGCELWDFSLVDPDNRRPVDFAHRQSQLQALIEAERGSSRAVALRTLLGTLEDGRAKLLATAHTLALRADLPELFRDGDYRRLEARGPMARCVCAFARSLGADRVVTVAPRWYTRLVRDTSLPLPPAEVWADTRVELPGGDVQYLDVFTGRTLTAVAEGERYSLAVSEILKDFPVALLRAGA
jgi:(1->4)-alpha-D-glucan 1-alpha-D-glucosylmutase